MQDKLVEVVQDRLPGIRLPCTYSDYDKYNVCAQAALPIQALRARADQVLRCSLIGGHARVVGMVPPYPSSD